MNSIALIQDTKITPKPTKSDIRLAMAKAIREQQRAAYEEEKKRRDAELKKIHKEAIRLLKKKGVFDTSADFNGWSHISCVEVRVKMNKADSEMAPLVERWNEIQRSGRMIIQDERDIVKELIEAERKAKGSPVDKLLSDPAIKKKLLKLGNQMLNGDQGAETVSV